MLYSLRRLVGRSNGVYKYYARRHLSSSLPLFGQKVLQKFKLADIGEGITECEIIKWSVKPQASVSQFDPLCEVQSDKASVEITSPFDGVLKEILVNEGDVAKVGEGLCLIEVDEEVADGVSNAEPVGGESPQGSQPSQPTPAPAQTSESQPPPKVESEPETQRRLHPLDPNYVPPTRPSAAFKPSYQQSTPRGAHDILAAPSVRHYARSKQVDLAMLAPGSGRDGRIEKADVDAFLSRSATPAAKEAPTPQQEDVVVELGRTRYGMWKAMEKSLEIPHFGYSTYFDVTNLQHVLASLNASIPPKYLPESSRKPNTAAVNPSALYPAPNQDPVPESHQFNKLTFLPLLLKSLSLTMMEWPLFRSSITADLQKQAKPTLTLRPNADVALALSTPTGLYTPTLLGINAQSVFDIQAKLKNLQHLGRQVPSGLTPKEMPKRGGTITISNVGSIGKGVFASPVLVPGGGVAICAIGRAHWVMDVDEEYWNQNQQGQRRLKLPISWSADHRVVEGAELAAFVESWRAYVEDPNRMIGLLQ